ncbi:MAG: RDD family protein, partial [Gammaproteobacteria bacterium]
WGLVLVTAQGARVDCPRAAVRLLAALLSLAPLGLGYWWALWDRDGLTWHDRLSGTRVVRG